MTRQKYLVRVVRPVFQTTYLEVEGRSEAEACSEAISSAYHIPDENWSGRYNPEEHIYDVDCVRSSETPEGHPFSLLDFPQYSILSTSEHPCPVCDGVQPWMNDLNALTVASQMSKWIEQLESSRRGYYEEAIEALEETLRKWKGTDQKVVPLLPPEAFRNNIDFAEALLNLVRLLNDVD